MEHDERFFNACQYGIFKLVKHLHGRVKTGKNYDLAVRRASVYGHLEVVKYLVEKGADFRYNENDAVRCASMFGHLEVVKYLIEMGADFRACDNQAVRWASENGHLEVIKYLIEKGADAQT
jgi:ankyrin repeat protein